MNTAAMMPSAWFILLLPRSCRACVSQCELSWQSTSRTKSCTHNRAKDQGRLDPCGRRADKDANADCLPGLPLAVVDEALCPCDRGEETERLRSVRSCRSALREAGGGGVTMDVLND